MHNVFVLFEIVKGLGEATKRTRAKTAPTMANSDG